MHFFFFLWRQLSILIVFFLQILNNFDYFYFVFYSMIFGKLSSYFIRIIILKNRNLDVISFVIFNIHYSYQLFFCILSKRILIFRRKLYCLLLYNYWTFTIFFPLIFLVDYTCPFLFFFVFFSWTIFTFIYFFPRPSLFLYNFKVISFLILFFIILFDKFSRSHFLLRNSLLFFHVLIMYIL